MIQMAMDQYPGKKWKILFQLGIQGQEHSGILGLDREVRVRSVIPWFSNILNGQNCRVSKRKERTYKS